MTNAHESQQLSNKYKQHLLILSSLSCWERCQGASCVCKETGMYSNIPLDKRIVWSHLSGGQSVIMH